MKMFEHLSEEKQLLSKDQQPLTKLQQFQALKGAELYFECDGLGYFEFDRISYICPYPDFSKYYVVGLVGDVGWNETDLETGENIFFEETDREFEVSLWLQNDGNAYVFDVSAI